MSDDKDKGASKPRETSEKAKNEQIALCAENPQPNVVLAAAPPPKPPPKSR